MDENIADIFMKAFLALAHLQELREKLEVSCAWGEVLKSDRHGNSMSIGVEAN